MRGMGPWGEVQQSVCMYGMYVDGEVMGGEGRSLCVDMYVVMGYVCTAYRDERYVHTCIRTLRAFFNYIYICIYTHKICMYQALAMRKVQVRKTPSLHLHTQDVCV